MTNENRNAVIDIFCALYLYLEDFLRLLQVTSSPLPAGKKLFREEIKATWPETHSVPLLENHKWKTISGRGKVIQKCVFTYIFLSTVLCDAWAMTTQQKLRSWEVHVCRGWIISLVLTTSDNFPFHLYVSISVFYCLRRSSVVLMSSIGAHLSEWLDTLCIYFVTRQKSMKWACLLQWIISRIGPLIIKRECIL